MHLKLQENRPTPSNELSPGSNTDTHQETYAPGNDIGQMPTIYVTKQNHRTIINVRDGTSYTKPSSTAQVKHSMPMLHSRSKSKTRNHGMLQRLHRKPRTDTKHTTMISIRDWNPTHVTKIHRKGLDDTTGPTTDQPRRTAADTNGPNRLY